ncbi:hypothetical protein TNCV_3569891 [Trichonephila clavipes]|nr:hypothetical protein TNCV_3569891 [Trichonephila clavipes]
MLTWRQSGALGLLESGSPSPLGYERFANPNGLAGITSAKLHRVPTYIYGPAMAINFLVALLFYPIACMMVASISCKQSVSTGIFVIGVCKVLFGTLALVAADPFVILSYSIQIVEGIGFSILLASTYVTIFSQISDKAHRNRCKHIGTTPQHMVRSAEPEKKMFKNCRKEDFRIVALELGETVAEKVTIVELTEIIKENKYFKEDVEFVKELIQYTIEDRKKAEEERKKAEETRLREKELELARLNVRVNSDNERTGEGCNSLDALVKSVRILTVKVPNRPEERKTVNRDLFVLSVKRGIIKRYIIQNERNTRKARVNPLGTEVFYELMLPGQFKMEGSNVIFQNTVFGFVTSGSTSSDSKGKEHCGFIQAVDNLELSIEVLENRKCRNRFR